LLAVGVGVLIAFRREWRKGTLSAQRTTHPSLLSAPGPGGNP
jgi:hypothetical protein